MNIPDPSHLIRDSINVYAEEFRRHQQAIKAHLAGKLEEEHQSLPPGFFPPASYWTPDEKDLFFHGLAIHSRLQPELIAAHIKTKSTFDVCVYLEALERGLACAEEGGLVEPLLRQDLDQAMEVSERWIGREEDIAESLMHLDACPWSFEVFLDEGGTSKTPEACTCLGRKQEAASDFNEDEDEDHGSEEWGPVKKKDMYLSHLDSTGLMMLESIFRDVEAEVSHNGDNGATESEGAQSTPPKGDAARQSNTPQPADGDGPHPADSAGPIPAIPDHTSIPISESGSVEPSEDTILGPADKDVRRKLLNRLYMRRKRAEATGRVTVSDLGKQRPGRHKKVRKPPFPRPVAYKPRKKRLRGKAVHTAATTSPTPSNDSAEEGSNPQDQEDTGIDDAQEAEDGNAHVEEAEAMYERNTRGGTTRPVRVKTVFSHKGVDAEVISELDLTFFHISTLARLLRLFNAINDPNRNLNNVSISVECIHLFKDIIKDFVSEVIHRAIMAKEQEARLKSKIKVWKYGQDEISLDNMRECLTSMGLPRFSKDVEMARRFGNDQNASEPSEDAEDEDITMHTAEDIPDETPKTPQPLASRSYLANLTYCDLFTASDDIIATKFDKEAYEKELKEEIAIGKRDEDIFKAYEMMLWKEHR